MLQIIYKAEERFKTIKLSLDTDQHNRHTTANGNICKILQQHQLHKSFILNISTSTIIPIFSSNKLPFKLNIVNAKKREQSLIITSAHLNRYKVKVAHTQLLSIGFGS